MSFIDALEKQLMIYSRRCYMGLDAGPPFKGSSRLFYKTMEVFRLMNLRAPVGQHGVSGQGAIRTWGITPMRCGMS